MATNFLTLAKSTTAPAPKNRPPICDFFREYLEDKTVKIKK